MSYFDGIVEELPPTPMDPECSFTINPDGSIFVQAATGVTWAAPGHRIVKERGQPDRIELLGVVTKTWPAS